MTWSLVSFNNLRATFISPYEGVVPPSGMPAHSSTRLAPPSCAANPQKALEDIISLGCDRILTSGQQPKAVEGVALLAELKKIAAGRIILLAGCGVNEDNIRTIFDATDIHEYHFSARVNVPSKMKQLNTNVYMGAEGADEANSLVTSAERVKQTIANLLG